MKSNRSNLKYKSVKKNNIKNSGLSLKKKKYLTKKKKGGANIKASKAPETSSFKDSQLRMLRADFSRKVTTGDKFVTLEDINQSEKREASKMGSSITSFGKSVTGELIDAVKGKVSGSCQIIPERFKNETIDSTKIRRIIKEHPFFKGEDDTFMAVIQKNVNKFCYETEYDDKDESGKVDKSYYYRLCMNIFDTCLKTPPLLFEVILDAISEEAVVEAFKNKPYELKKQIFRRIGKKKNIDFKALKTKGDNNNRNNNDRNNNNKKTWRYTRKVAATSFGYHGAKGIDTILPKTPKDIQAEVLAELTDEIKYHISNFIVSIFVKSIIDYKELAGEEPTAKYTGNVRMEPHINKLIKQIRGTYKKPKKAKQSGGANKEGEDKSSSPLPLTQLKKITADELAKYLRDPKRLNGLKADLGEEQDNPSEENEYEKEDGDEDDSADTPITVKPWFLSVILGTLAITASIEFGFWDAKPCMSHTFI